jgi:hypothetical protein
MSTHPLPSPERSGAPQDGREWQATTGRLPVLPAGPRRGELAASPRPRPAARPAPPRSARRCCSAAPQLWQKRHSTRPLFGVAGTHIYGERAARDSPHKVREKWRTALVRARFYPQVRCASPTAAARGRQIEPNSCTWQSRLGGRGFGVGRAKGRYSVQGRVRWFGCRAPRRTPTPPGCCTDPATWFRCS